jgi:hypothetical protein
MTSSMVKDALEKRSLSCAPTGGNRVAASGRLRSVRERGRPRSLLINGVSQPRSLPKAGRSSGGWRLRLA